MYWFCKVFQLLSFSCIMNNILQLVIHLIRDRVRNLKFASNLKFATSKTLVNFMKKMMFLSKNWCFSVQKALIYYTVNKSHHNSFILLVFSHVANFRYVANFRFLTLHNSSTVHVVSVFTAFHIILQLCGMGSSMISKLPFWCHLSGANWRYTIKVLIIWHSPAIFTYQVCSLLKCVRIASMGVRINQRVWE